MNSISLNRDKVDAVVLDLDGTLIDTLGDFVVAINLMLDDLALPGSPQVNRESVARMVGKGSENLVISVLNHVAAQYPSAVTAINSEALEPRFLFESSLGFYQQHYALVNGQHARVYPGVLEGLHQLKQSGFKLACLTNKPLAFAQRLLQIKGLEAFFNCVFGGDSFEHKKPHPLPLVKTCAALGSLPARTLMVGDSSNDALAARAAGCPVCLVSYGYNHGKPVHLVDADGVIDSLVELLAEVPMTP